MQRSASAFVCFVLALWSSYGGAGTVCLIHIMSIANRETLHSQILLITSLFHKRTHSTQCSGRAHLSQTTKLRTTRCRCWKEPKTNPQLQTTTSQQIPLIPTPFPFRHRTWTASTPSLTLYAPTSLPLHRTNHAQSPTAMLSFRSSVRNSGGCQ